MYVVLSENSRLSKMYDYFVIELKTLLNSNIFFFFVPN